MENDLAKLGVHTIFGPHNGLSTEPMTGRTWEDLYKVLESWGKKYVAPDFWEDLAAYRKETNYVYSLQAKDKNLNKNNSGTKLVIGLSGPAGAGKSTVANVLKERGFKELVLADPMKYTLSVLFCTPRENFENQDFKHSIAPVGGKTYREMLQTIGTECWRSVDQNLWVNLLAPKIDKVLKEQSLGAVIPDMRYDNEALSILKLNSGKKNANIMSIIIKIDRPGIAKISGSHPSEQGLSPNLVTATIINEGSVEDLSLKVEQVLKRFKSRESLTINGRMAIQKEVPAGETYER